MQGINREGGSRAVQEYLEMGDDERRDFLRELGRDGALDFLGKVLREVFTKPLGDVYARDAPEDSGGDDGGDSGADGVNTQFTNLGSANVQPGSSPVFSSRRGETLDGMIASKQGANSDTDDEPDPTLGGRLREQGKKELESRTDASSSLRDVVDNEEGGEKVQLVESYGRNSIKRKISITNMSEIFDDDGGEHNSVGDAFRQGKSGESLDEQIRNDAASPIEVVESSNGPSFNSRKVEVSPDGEKCRVINVDELDDEQRRIIREGMAR